MEGILHFQLFIITAMIIILVPGPDFIYVTTCGISNGNKAGIVSACGISAGILVLTLFAALGLSAIIQTSKVAFTVIKFLGAGYLIFIGIKAMMSKNDIQDFSADKFQKKDSMFLKGIVTNVFNPKAIITFMALLPQFVSVNNANPKAQFILLGLILSAMSIAWLGLVGYFAGIFGNVIKKNKSIQNGIKYVSGSIMVALGLKLATSQK